MCSLHIDSTSMKRVLQATISNGSMDNNACAMSVGSTVELITHEALAPGGVNVMDNAVIERLEASFNLLAPRGEELVDRFYANLFAKNPQVRPMFSDDMAEQKKKLLAAIVLVIQNIRTPEKLADPLKKLGAKHVQYKTQPEHYPIVRDTLVGVMKDMAGSQWNDQLTSDWTGALDFVASVMLEGHKAEVANPAQKAA